MNPHRLVELRKSIENLRSMCRKFLQGLAVADLEFRRGRMSTGGKQVRGSQSEYSVAAHRRGNVAIIVEVLRIGIGR